MYYSDLMVKPNAHIIWVKFQKVGKVMGYK